MEGLIVSTGDGRYFVPMFVTFDSNLRELLGYYPVKGVMFNRDTGWSAPIPKINTKEYFALHGCLNELDWLFSESLRSERLFRAKPTRLSIHKLIQREYRALRRVISYPQRRSSV
jgi:hypothetical protein